MNLLWCSYFGKCLWAFKSEERLEKISNKLGETYAIKYYENLKNNDETLT